VSTLADLCKQGAEGVRSGDYDAVRFDVFNTEERDEVYTIMAERYPDVKFATTWLGEVGDGTRR